IAEFWRRWHISLSSWFRDYLYIPLGGSRVSTLKQIRNTFIIFIVSGFWHGANWTFIAWGALNAIYFLPLLLLKKNRNNLEIVAQGRLFPSVKEFHQIGITFLITVFAWIFFRAENISAAFNYISQMMSKSILSIPQVRPVSLIIPLIFFVAIEWLGRENKYAIEKLGFKWPRPLRWGFYYSLVIAVYMMGGKEQQFIYFQF
ncbi:MAG: MBOAT family O-acyltransferase, partial [Bacteroidia bacterium]